MEPANGPCYQLNEIKTTHLTTMPEFKKYGKRSVKSIFHGISEAVFTIAARSSTRPVCRGSCVLVAEVATGTFILPFVL